MENFTFNTSVEFGASGLMLLPPTTKTLWILRIFLHGIFPMIGLIGNSFCAVTILLHKKVRDWNIWMIFNMAIADSLYCLTLICITFPGNLKDRWIFNDAVCRLQYLVGPLCLLSTMLSLVMQAVHRYITLSLSHKNPVRNFIRNRQPIVIALIWGISLSIIVPIVANSLPTLLYPFRDTCFILLTTDRHFLMALIGLLLLIPAVVIPILYLLIYTTLKKATAQVATEDMRSTRRSRDIKVTLRLFLLYVLFLVTYMPIVTTVLIPDRLARDYVYMRNAVIASSAPLIIITALNPLIYRLFFPKLGKAYVAVLTCKRKVADLEESVTDNSVTRNSTIA